MRAAVFSGMPTPDWSFFRSALLHWYSPERRPMPWKEVGDPYRVWLSEIILQQTRVAQGMPYYERFLATYPTVTDLARADDDAVMKLWEGLGYYSRARNLLLTARMVASDLDGRFPDTYEGLRTLPGVGPYTAAAIASFAFGRQVAVLDGNVFRILARYAGDSFPADGSGGRAHFQQLVDAALGDAPAAAFNQAIMDFGALICTPRNAACRTCPLADHCVALRTGQVYELPVKTKTVARRTRHFHYLVVTDDEGRTLLQQRTDKDIWQNLYEFPLVEAGATELRLDELSQASEWPAWLPVSALSGGHRSPVYRQQLSHQTILAVFHRLTSSVMGDLPAGVIWVPKGDLTNYAFPRVITRYLEQKALTLDL